jgi:hypothetical protein
LFPPSEIKDWIDPAPGERIATDELDAGETALCPRCGIDAVLPDRLPGATLDAALLREMHAFWF